MGSEPGQGGMLMEGVLVHRLLLWAVPQLSVTDSE